MKRRDTKSNCPVNFTLEIFGDQWSLLIVRGMLVSGLKTFGEFLSMEERISTRMLAERLEQLEARGILTKQSDLQDKRRTIYSLTEVGLNLIPVLYEISTWGSRTSPNPQASAAWFKAMELDKESVIDAWYKAARSGSSFSHGPMSVVSQLALE